MTQEASAIFEAAAGSAGADPNALERMNQLADEALKLEAQVKQMEDDLKVASRALNEIKSKALPELMSELGLEKVVRNGHEISTYDFVSGSLPKDEEARARAIQWLEEHGGAGLIKTEVSMAFSKEEREEAVRVYRLLKSNGIEPRVDTGVHSATLQAYARERLRGGEEIDTEALGLYTGRVVKIKPVKEPSRRSR